ncbi:hypothetical protein HTV80_29310 [Streptomyces sp. Vc74B-19]|uniref:hypothetical protein n=1 Tax=unclassified Streptomyces TaxID=2593676 RepID=UPI001BFCC094|nr:MULTISPECIES: hypothetical protein [unclassified Streptomyces]MBT3167161.1 hypothetical protein [Streptomyces sp. Vc74B-19]MCO4700498.1 hypothetical protein [Streptomyces sp. RO-S4]MDU0301173.1 hypothetical protein [Streptomyces sp. PAL114]
MVTATREASHRLFQEHPEALAPVFEALGLPPPMKTDFHELSPDTTEIRPMERRADVTKYWFEVVEVGLESTPARENWRKLMQNVVTHFPGHGTLFEEKYLEGRSEGKAEGKSEAILRALKVRGLTVPDDVRKRITGCTDLDTLATWFDRSLTVSEAEGLFTDEAEETTPS